MAAGQGLQVLVFALCFALSITLKTHTETMSRSSTEIITKSATSATVASDSLLISSSSSYAITTTARRASMSTSPTRSYQRSVSATVSSASPSASGTGRSGSLTATAYVQSATATSSATFTESAMSTVTLSLSRSQNITRTDLLTKTLSTTLTLSRLPSWTRMTSTRTLTLTMFLTDSRSPRTRTSTATSALTLTSRLSRTKSTTVSGRTVSHYVDTTPCPQIVAITFPHALDSALMATAGNITIQLVILGGGKRFGDMAGPMTIRARVDATTPDGISPQPSPAGFASISAAVSKMEWHFDSVGVKFHLAQLQLPPTPFYSIEQDETIVFTVLPEAFQFACSGTREARVVVTCNDPSFLLPASRAVAAAASVASLGALFSGFGGMALVAQSQLIGLGGVAPCAPVQGAVAAGLNAFTVAPAFRSSPELMMLINLVIAVGIVAANAAVAYRLGRHAGCSPSDAWARARFPFASVVGVSLCAKGFALGVVGVFQADPLNPVLVGIGAVGLMAFVCSVPGYCYWHTVVRVSYSHGDDRLRFFRLSEHHPIRSSTRKGLSVLLLPSGFWEGAAERKSLRHLTPVVGGRLWAAAYPAVLSLALGLVGGVRRESRDCSGLLYALAAIVLALGFVLAVGRPFTVPFTHMCTLVVHVLFALQLVTAGQYLAAPTRNVVIVFSASSCVMSIVIVASSVHAVWLGMKEERIIRQDAYCREDQAVLIDPSLTKDQDQEAAGMDEAKSVMGDASAHAGPTAQQRFASPEMTSAASLYKECSAMRLDCAASLRRMIVLASVFPPTLSREERRVRLAALIAVVCQHALLGHLLEDVSGHLGTLL